MVVQWLRAWPALAEDLNLDPNTHTGWLITTCNSSSRVSSVLVNPLWASAPPQKTEIKS